MKVCLHNVVGKIFQISIICFSLSQELYSQAYIFDNEKVKWEIGINFGPSFFLGDLGGNAGKGSAFLKDVNVEFTKLMKGVFITAYPNKWMGIRLAADYTYLEGRDDVINTTGINELWRKQRNLDFKTDIWEVYACAELFPTMFFKRKDDFEPKFRPYGLIGIGIFHFNPKGSLAEPDGSKSWYALQPLRTEGQGMPEYPYSKPYKLTQVNIPLGAGVKYFVSDRVNVSMEFLYRKTFTDYIDDVSKQYIDANDFIKVLPAPEAAIASKISDKTIGIIYPGMTRFPSGTQRGDLKDGDTYFSVVAKIGFRLGPIYESNFARRAAKQLKCPVVY